MFIRGWFSIFLLYILFSSASVGQSLTIKGHVLSGPKNVPLPLAAVYLAGTTKGTLTDEQGAFMLTNLPAGQFDLIVSFIGYATLKTTVYSQQQRAFRLILKPLDTQLNVITVRAHPNRSSYSSEMLNLFTDNFIGRTPNAERCRLINPKVLLFSEDDSSMSVMAAQPLVIENQALGYRLTYNLEHFTYNLRRQRVSYQGYPYYEELVPKDTQQRKDWQERRKLAYQGSLMHFMRALYDRQLVQQGFVIQALNERTNRMGNRYFVGLPTDSTAQFPSLENARKQISLPMGPYKLILDSTKSTTTQPVVNFKGWLQVVYARKKESLSYQRLRETGSDRYGLVLQHSYIRQLIPDLALAPDGRFNLQGILFEGYWTWELLGDSLPTDYAPD